MLSLQRIFDQLAQKELRNVSVGDTKKGVIAEADYLKMLGYVNEAVQKLHERFNLKTAEFVLVQQVGINTYHIDKKYAISNTESTEPIKYINDTVYPFTDEFVSIKNVFNSDFVPVTLNRRTEPYPIYHREGNTLHMEVDPNAIQSFLLECKMKPANVEMAAGFNIRETMIDIPDYLEGVLRKYITFKLYEGIPAATIGERDAASVFEYKYNMACKEIDDQGLVPAEDHDDNERFDNNGFV